jgi:hypothetical protein
MRHDLALLNTAVCIGWGVGTNFALYGEVDRREATSASQQSNGTLAGAYECITLLGNAI